MKVLAWVAGGIVVLVVGLIAVLALFDAGRKVVSDVACRPPRTAYGMAPGSWNYGRADAKTEAKIRKAMKLSSSSDVTLARKSGETNVVLVAVPHVGHSFVTGFEKGGKEVGATAGDGPHGTTALTYPTAYAVVGMKGCNAVVVDGQDSAGVTTLADTIFAD